jgi:hypothetical protein
MKQLECKKRFDEREKKKKEFQIEKDKERERKLEQKRLETDIINEMRKPTEDMSLPDSKALPELPRIEGLRLCGDAFANVLMVFEFLNTFGERLGFGKTAMVTRSAAQPLPLLSLSDMESLPTLSELQSALLNDPDAEEELLSVLIHLLVCAIDDPGIPMIHRHLTLLGQNLRQADITNTNVSEILRLYLIARGQVSSSSHYLNCTSNYYSSFPGGSEAVARSRSSGDALDQGPNPRDSLLQEEDGRVQQAPAPDQALQNVTLDLGKEFPLSQPHAEGRHSGLRLQRIAQQ